MSTEQLFNDLRSNRYTLKYLVRTRRRSGPNLNLWERIAIWFSSDPIQESLDEAESFTPSAPISDTTRVDPYREFRGVSIGQLWADTAPSKLKGGN